MRAWWDIGHGQAVGVQRWKAITTRPYIEPYQGASDWRWRILRDVSLQWAARPIASDETRCHSAKP